MNAGTPAWRRAQAAALLRFGRAIELPDGGFGWLGDDGTPDRSQPRPLFLTARITYVHALAALGGGDAEHARLAAVGVELLRTRFADAEHGGWVAGLDVNGDVDDPSKANYAHAHVLLAAATAVVAGVSGARDLLDRAGDVITERFWRDEDGAALESWDAAFTASEPYRGANSNMHSVEAYLVAGDVTGDANWHQRALAVSSKVIDGFARDNGWRIPEHFDADWTPLLDYNTDQRDDRFRPYGTTPGHSFEWARLLLTLEAALGDPPSWLAGAAVALFDRAVTDGWAVDGHDGFVYTVDNDGQSVVTSRLHWVICEAILAAHALHGRTGETRFGEDAARWWRHVDEHFLDHERGGWWQELDAELRPARTIWPGKPDLYHSYQALVLPSLPLAPCAALALAEHPPAPSA